MSALARLRERGLRLRAVGEQLMVEPRSALTEDLRVLIRSHKGSILKELASANERVARQARVEAELFAHPEWRVAFDVIDAPLRTGPGEPVSVVVAVRHGEHILSGELSFPRERWDLALFMRLINSGSELIS